MSGSSAMVGASLQSSRPVILIGMHRSGTSLTARLLQDLGIHMGYKVSMNAEPFCLRALNERIFKKAGASWADISPLVRALESSDFIDKEAAALLPALFDGSALRRFFGPDLWPQVANGVVPPWGWKDPRTSLTFPIWSHVFPEARFVHVLRNGIDVAISLHRRATQNAQWWKRLLPFYDYNARMLDFANCFGLWEDYVSFILEHKSAIPQAQYLEVRYEEMLSAPRETLATVLDFAGMEMKAETLESTSRRVNRGRLDNSRLMSLYRDKIESLNARALLSDLGY